MYDDYFGYCVYYRKSSIKPPPGSLFNIEKMTVSVLDKDLEYKVDKLKYKTVWGHAAGDENQIQTSSW